MSRVRKEGQQLDKTVIRGGTWAVARALRLASMMASAISNRRLMREVFMGYPSNVIASVIDHIFVL